MKQSKKKIKIKLTNKKYNKIHSYIWLQCFMKKKRKIHMDILFNLAYFLNIYFC